MPLKTLLARVYTSEDERFPIQTVPTHHVRRSDGTITLRLNSWIDSVVSLSPSVKEVCQAAHAFSKRNLIDVVYDESMSSTSLTAPIVSSSTWKPNPDVDCSLRITILMESGQEVNMAELSEDLEFF